MMIIVSACLAGINCRYDGKNSADLYVRELVAQGKAIPVCPEQMGGMETPRVPSEIQGGTGADVLTGKARVVNKDGTDVTECFIKGAFETLHIAKLTGAELAVMKSMSPSCGCGTIYDGDFSGGKRDGNGVSVELLLKNGINVKTEKSMKKTPDKPTRKFLL